MLCTMLLQLYSCMPCYGPYSMLCYATKLLTKWKVVIRMCIGVTFGCNRW